MYVNSRQIFVSELEAIRYAGTWRHERMISSAQGVRIAVDGRSLLNLCANNYLALSNHPALIAAAKLAMDKRGYGLSSVRFICGTQDQHRELERGLAQFVGSEDAVLFGSCFDANGGVFEALLAEPDAIISDELNHASIIDGIRLSKARRLRYRHKDLESLQQALLEARDARIRLVVTDGVFSMDGDYAPLDGICLLANQHNAMVMVDDSHASGFVGPTGRGTPERLGVTGQIDILTSTLGKALGGASGGFIATHAEIADLIRQRSRPYLFSNSLPPPIVAASLAALDLLSNSHEWRDRLMANASKFRSDMSRAGFDILPGDHPIVPIMLGDARVASQMAQDLFDEGIYVVGFSFPVVPEGKARIRVQLSSAHSGEEIEQAVQAFVAVGRRRGLIS